MWLHQSFTVPRTLKYLLHLQGMTFWHGVKGKWNTDKHKVFFIVLSNMYYQAQRTCRDRDRERSRFHSIMVLMIGLSHFWSRWLVSVISGPKDWSQSFLVLMIGLGTVLILVPVQVPVQVQYMSRNHLGPDPSPVACLWKYSY